MRKAKRWFAATVAAAALVAGCGGTDANVNASLTATITGSGSGAGSFTATTVQGNYSTSTYLLSFSGVNIGTGVQLLFQIPNVTATGPYSVGIGQLGVAQFVVASGLSAQTWTTALTGGSGTITVQTLSSTSASGIFTFTAPPTAGTGATGTATVSGDFTVHF